MPKTLPRLQTGIDGLDEILCGGLVAGSSYIIQGRPGSGKTIFANQISCALASRGQKVLVATILSESHERLFEYLSTLDFFDRRYLGDRISYVSAFEVLRDEGLDGVIAMLREEIIRQEATLLVVDGLLNARSMAESEIDTKRFVAGLQTHAAAAGCTVLFLTSARLEDSSPEHTMVDGVLELSDDLSGVRAVRRLHLRKVRGSPGLRGLHNFEITERGLTFYPRLEALLSTPSVRDAPSAERVASGVPALDVMLQGGLQRGALTLVVGPTGVGKTVLGVNFLAQASAEEPALHFGFYETAERLRLKASAIGLDLDESVRSGALEILWRPATENLIDALGLRLLDAVRKRGVRRLFIDGLGAFERAAVHKPRLVEFFAALSNELRALGVTTLATWEMRDLFGSPIISPAPEISTAIDNLVLMRFVEHGARVRRVLSVLKVRDSDFDASVREFVITNRGVDLRDTFGGESGILTGEVQPAQRG